MTEIIRIDGIDFDADRVSLNFNGIKVGGLPVPNKEVVTAIMKTMPDIKSQVLFSAASNMWVSIYDSVYNPQHYVNRSYSPLVEQVKQRLKLIEIDKKQSQILGYDFNKLHHSRALMSWYEFVIGNRVGKDVQKLRKGLSKIESISKGKADLLSLKIPCKEFPRLLTFDEYSQARSYLESFIDTLKASVSNPDIEQLILEAHPLHKSIVNGSEARPLKIPQSFWCPFCKDYQLMQGLKKTPKACATCGKFVYQKNWENTHRPSKGDPVGWVKAFDGIPQECQGEKCLLDLPGKRQVNVSIICRECFLKSL
jgi:hypothetical protein